MGEWQKLTAEAATLEKLVQVHRLQHRRTGYFARVLDVRRRVRAVLGKGAHLAQVEQALHAIRAAWKDLQSLLIQTYFMPYAIVHLALLSRLATLLSAHHAHLRSTLRIAPAPAQTQPALLALCASTSSDTALDRIFTHDCPVHAVLKQQRAYDIFQERKLKRIKARGWPPEIHPNRLKGWGDN